MSHSTPTRQTPAAARRSLLEDLRSGKVPTQGLLEICVGRDREKAALFESVKSAVGGGYTFRVIAGQYGSGKTFLVELMRAVARGNKAKMLTMKGELSPDKLLVGGRAQRDDLWQDLIGSLTAVDDGEPGEGQLVLVLNAFAAEVEKQARSELLGQSHLVVADELLSPIRLLTQGAAFAEVVRLYVKASYDGDATMRQHVLTWLTGGFTTSMEARRSVKMGRFEAGLTDRLRLLAALARCAGWNGLFVCIDEMDKLLKLPKAQCQTNLMEIHRLVDLNAKRAPGLAVFLSGAPGFVDDPRRGLFSSEPIKQRLSSNPWASQTAEVPLVDYRSPVLRLESLTPTESRALLHKIREVFAAIHPTLTNSRLPEAAIDAYLRHCQLLIGAETHLRPRNTIRSFVGLLDILDQNPHTTWHDLLKNVRVDHDSGESGIHDDYRIS